MSHLRSQVVALKASAEQASAAANAAANAASSALSAAAAERDAALEGPEAAHGRAQHAAQLMQLQVALQQARHDKELLQSSVTDLARRWESIH